METLLFSIRISCTKSTPFQPQCELYPFSSRFLKRWPFRAPEQVLTDALVSHIIFADAPQGSDVTASSVAFNVVDQHYSVNAAKEVIVSAG